MTTEERPTRDGNGGPAGNGDRPVTVVGVGASAGGLEAFRELLEELPGEPGIALVYVQHMDPGHESMLSSLLGHVAHMPVLQVKETMTLLPNHVYVAPPRTDVTVQDGQIVATRISKPMGRHNTIDTFLRSLASARGPQAVGVLLSGTASDGVLGLRAIKGEGGIAFVQDMTTARFDGMPRAAIEAGVADFVLPPREIARELMRIGEHLQNALPHPQHPDEEPAPQDGDAMHRILSLVWKRSNVDFSFYKPSTLRRRVLRRLVLSQLETMDEYAQLLERNPAEVRSLYEDLVINVTSFFRDPEVFDLLKSDVFPRILQGKSGDMPIRLWVPGCSTGEEVYSLAITLLEFLGEKAVTTTIQIFGTDISETAIERARAGVYPKDIETDVLPDRLNRFFIEREEGYQIAKAVRDLCVFARQNVFKDPPFSNLDLISCRNVLIYFGPELQKRVLPLFYYALRGGGYLVLGSAESVGNFADYFVPAHPNYRVYTKRTVPGQLLAPLTGDYIFHPTPATKVAPELGRSFDPLREADRVLLERYGPPAALIDRDLNILQFRGRTGPYLEPAPGSANFNLLRMAREGLMVAIHTSVHEAMASGAPVRKDAVRFKSNGDLLTVNIRVIPLTNPAPGAEKFMLVLFESEEKEHREIAAPALNVVPDAALGTIDVRRLREELIATKEYLQSVIESQETFNEELRSANEEILSSNEELQSTNEELETAKEELQSANEELTSLNEELQTRNQELAKVNADLSNLLNSINIAIVMLDDELRVRRFTPPAERLLNLIKTDVGRPFSQINPAIVVPDLEAHVREVINTLEIRDLEAQDREGRWYSLRIRPYKTAENRIEGAVLALVEIDTEKRSKARAEYTTAFADATAQMVMGPVVQLYRDLTVRRANKAFCELFDVAPHQVEGRSVLELNSGAWNAPALRGALEDIVAGRQQFVQMDLDLDVPALGPRRVTMRARQLPANAGSEAIILVAIGAGLMNGPPS